MSQSRDATRTKTVILEATLKLLASEGTRVTIAQVAAAAGVSKGGLLHHFKSRENLFYEATVNSIERFRAEVLTFVDLSENAPGKLLRAYVRALCGGSEFVMRAFSHGAVWAQLNSIPGALHLNEMDSARWEQEFAADGLDQHIIDVVRLAAEGAVQARLTDNTFSRDDLEVVKVKLLTLTLPFAGKPAHFPQLLEAEPLDR